MRLDLMKVLVVFALIGAVATGSNAQEKSVETWWSDSNVYITPGGDEGARAVIAGDIRPQVQQLSEEVNQLKAGQKPSGDMVTNEQATVTPIKSDGFWLKFWIFVAVVLSVIALILALTRRQGERGEKGERGEPGPQGIPGRDGLPGRDGRDGEYAMVSNGQGGLRPALIVDEEARKAANDADKKAEQALKVARSASELAQRNRQRINSIGKILSGIIGAIGELRAWQKSVGAISDIRAWQKSVDEKIDLFDRFARAAASRFLQLFAWATALEISQVITNAKIEQVSADSDFAVRCVGDLASRSYNLASQAKCQAAAAQAQASGIDRKVEVLTDFAAATVNRPSDAEFYRRRGITDRLKRILDGDR